VEFIKETLAFESLTKCVDWLTDFELIYMAADKTVIDCKNSTNVLANF
jgi:hypothetical protein